MLPTQAGPEAAASQAPRFSVTQMVRGVQTANAQLAASRARRRRDRVLYLLCFLDSRSPSMQMSLLLRWNFPCSFRPFSSPSVMY